MNKMVIISLVLMLGFIAHGQDGAGKVPTTIVETVGDVQYVGTIYTLASDTNSLPSTNSPRWTITRITTSGGVQKIETAVNTNKGDAAFQSSIWATRASTNTVYK